MEIKEKAMFGLIFGLITFSFHRFLRLLIVPVKTNVRPPDAEVDGAQFNQGGVVNLINDLKTNASPAFGNTVQTTLSGTTNTWGADAMVGGLIKRFGTQSSADLTATAAQIIAAIPGAQVGQTFPLMVVNMTSGTMTPVANTGVTLLGTTTITRFSARMMVGKVLGSALVTLEGGFSFPTNQPD